MQTGWVQFDNTWYYLKQDGTMATEWLNVDNKWYYLLNGAMVTGWLRIGTDYYYLRGDGSMVTGWRLMDGAYYYFNTDGRLVRGWADVDGERYFFRTDGTMVTGWQTIDNLLYYFDPEGGLATKWEQIDGSWYYFGSQGTCCSGTASTYRVKVGKADDFLGTYRGSDGEKLSEGTYGDLVIGPSEDVAGTGHNTIVRDMAGDYWIVYHGFDIHGEYPSERTLFIDKLLFDESTGMPYVEGRQPTYRQSVVGPCVLAS